MHWAACRFPANSWRWASLRGVLTVVSAVAFWLGLATGLGPLPIFFVGLKRIAKSGLLDRTIVIRVGSAGGLDVERLRLGVVGLLHSAYWLLRGSETKSANLRRHQH